MNPLSKLRRNRGESRDASDDAPHATPRYGERYKASGEPRRRSRRREKDKERNTEPSFLARTVDHWWDRLLGAVYSRSFSEQSEQYMAHRTTRDYVCNTIGQALWGGLFPLLTIVCTQLVGAEQAGYFSMAFVVGTLLLFLGNYGVRTYQVSDIDEMESFYDYQLNRAITCVAMLAVGLVYCRLRGYDATMESICMGVLCFRAVDALADVYEGRLQQKDKLYLAGLSQAVRCGLAFIVFTVVLFVTRDLVWASRGMAIGAGVSFILLTLPLALFETDKSLPLSLRGVGEVFVQCFPLFIALFLYNLIDSMPKFAMEGVLTYDNQLYYNAMYFPAHAILMAVGFVYKPQLVRLAGIWADPDKHKRFDLIVLAMFAVIAVITGIMALFMGWIGIPIMSFLYGIDFEQYRSLVYVMVCTGGICAAIDFLYQIIILLREQQAVTRLYLIACAFSLPVALLLINFSGLAGAVVASVVIMAMLLVLLLSEYLVLRKRAETAY